MPFSLSLLSLFLYTLSAVSFFFYLKKFSRPNLLRGRLFLATAVAFHLGLMIAYFKSRGAFVPSRSVESQFLISAVISLVSLLLSLRKSFVFFVWPALIALGFSLLYFSFALSGEVGIEAPRPWLWSHIVLAVVGEACFFVTALLSIVYLVIDYQLRNKLARRFFALFPSLVELDSLTGEFLSAGFILLSLGLALGIAFASEDWAGQWLSDPKVVLALSTWFLYAMLLVLRAKMEGFRGRRSANLSLVIFVAVIFLSIGMDHLLPSRHYPLVESTEGSSR